MKSINRLFVFVCLVTIVCVFILVVTTRSVGNKVLNNKIQQPLYSPTPMIVLMSAPSVSLPVVVSPTTEKLTVEHNILLEVPFVVQAPRHNWKDLVYQNACEEASILMAMRWAEDRALTSEEAFFEIQKISDYSKKHYGFYLDQSSEDLAVLMRDYFKYPNVNYRKNIQTVDINAELKKGNLVLVPVNGQKLGNPYFTQPGPTEHMLVIKGYDTKTDEFITNDPGIGKGKGYRYKDQVLDKALQKYPSGYHEKINKVEKVMIVVGKK